MRVAIATLSGFEVAGMDIDATLKLDDVLKLLPNQAGGVECSREVVLWQDRAHGFHEPW